MSPVHDYVIANGTGSAVRSDLNNALAAIVSNNSSSSEPSTKYAYQWWADTTTGQLKLRNSANNAWVTIFELDGTMLMEDGSAASPGLSFASDLNTGFFRSAADKINFATGGVERLEIGSSEVVFNDGSNDVDFRVESNGNANMLFVDGGNDVVGIGNSSASSFSGVGANNLVVGSGSGTEGLTIYSGSSNNGNIAFADGTSGSAQYRGIVNYNHSVDAMTLQTAASEQMRIGSSGNTSIGTTTNTNKLRVHNGSDSANIILATGADESSEFISLGISGGLPVISAGGVGSTSADLAFRTADSGTETERMRITSGGDIFVAVTNGTKTNEGFRIENGGQPNITRGTDGTFISFYHTSGSVIGSIQNNGGTGTLFNTSSDYRLKENVVNIADGVDRVKQLSPKRFNFIADNTKTVDGFLAHEVQTIVPECISGKKDEVDDDGNAVMQGIDQSKLVPLLTAALQEAIAKIETLETKVAALEAG